MQRRPANQSGGNFSLTGSHSVATQFTTTSLTQSAGSISSNTQISAGDIAYYRERQRNRVFETVWMEFVHQSETEGLTKKTIAERLGKNPSQITRWLSGPANLELDTVSDLFLAMNSEMTIGCSSLLNRPTANYMHPTAISTHFGTWTSSSWQAPVNWTGGTTTRAQVDECDTSY